MAARRVSFGSKRESASLGLMSALASCGHNRANSLDAPKARRKLVTSVALTDTSLALSPGLASGLFLFAHSTNRRALAGWGSSSTRAQSPPHSVWGDREAAVPSMLSLILWRLSNALVHAKAGSRADSYYFGNRSLEARLWLTVARRCEARRSAHTVPEPGCSVPQ
jgi:hypothetical protein